MEFRNPTYNARGTIDVEINHPTLGWVPFTADPNDTEELGRAIFEEASAGPVAPYQPKPEPVPEVISRRQFYEALALPKYGIITQAEALAAMKSGALPAAIQTIVDGMTDADAKYETEMKLIGAGEFYRSSPLVLVFLVVLGWTEEQADALWIDASRL